MNIRGFCKESYLSLRNLLLRPLVLCPLRLRPLTDRDKIRNIIFFRHDRIGDLALSLPLISRLKQAFPAARLTVVASRANHALLLHNPDVDQVHIYEGLIPYCRFVAKKSFDLAIDPFHNEHRMFPAILTLLSGARHRTGFALAGREIFFTRPAPVYDEKKSFHQLMDALFASIGLVPADMPGDLAAPPVLLHLDPEERREADMAVSSLADKRRVAIHPGAFYPSQKWPLERFIDLANRLSGLGYGVIFFAPDKEFPAINLPGGKNADGPLYLRTASLRQFIAILATSELLICNNSGPLHLAWALGIKTVSLMGPTVPAVWWPQGTRHAVLRRDLPCSPCSLAVCPTHECLLNIEVSEVLSVAVKALAKEESK